jgi:hypothetical protein
VTLTHTRLQQQQQQMLRMPQQLWTRKRLGMNWSSNHSSSSSSMCHRTTVGS